MIAKGQEPRFEIGDSDDVTFTGAIHLTANQQRKRTDEQK